MDCRERERDRAAEPKQQLQFLFVSQLESDEARFMKCVVTCVGEFISGMLQVELNRVWFDVFLLSRKARERIELCRYHSL